MYLVICMGLGFFLFFGNSLVMWLSLELLSMYVLLVLIGLSLWDVNVVGVVVYFLVQAVGGILLALGILYDFCYYGNMYGVLCPVSNVSLLFVVLGLLVKLGLYPFYFWVVRVYGLLEGMQCYYIGVYSKVMPLLMLFGIFGFLGEYFLLLLAVCGVLVSGASGVLASDFRVLMGASSVGHGAWFLFAMYGGFFCLFLYFLFYVLLNYLVFNVMYLRGVNVFLNFGRGRVYFGLFLIVLLVFVNLGGFSPGLGFFLKMALTKGGLDVWGGIFCCIFLMLSVGVVFFYSRVMQFLFGVNNSYEVYRSWFWGRLFFVYVELVFLLLVMLYFWSYWSL
uniref:NADH-ubiquinone oxidoreductase chain 2 n=1 Tax=Halocynthia hilgendorfi ssp. n. KRK-2020 TaxID=2769794 RepID=A0A7G9XFM2_9ASCI|nr:NADH dehydrogenase subunit 2 [Halocynthia hilgendorfi ssp. n. KRK-2020]